MLKIIMSIDDKWPKSYELMNMPCVVQLTRLCPTVSICADLESFCPTSYMFQKHYNSLKCSSDSKCSICTVPRSKGSGACDDVGGVIQYVITPLLPISAKPRNAKLVEEQRANVTRPTNDDHLCLLIYL